MHSAIRKHWRMAVALAPSIVLGTVIQSWLQSLGYGRTGSFILQCAAGVAVAMVILWWMNRLLPSGRDKPGNDPTS